MNKPWPALTPFQRMDLSAHHAKIRREETEQLQSGERRLAITTVDCRVCGKPFVPHLVWDDAPPWTAGLCADHFNARFTRNEEKT